MFWTIQSPSRSRTWSTLSLLPSGTGDERQLVGADVDRAWRCGIGDGRRSSLQHGRCRSSACLLGDGLGRGLRPPRRRRGSGVAERRSRSVVELVDERDAGRDVELDDVVVGDARRGASPAPAASCRARRRARPCRRSRSGTMSSYQYGSIRSTTSARHSGRRQQVGRQVGVARVRGLLGRARRRRAAAAASRTRAARSSPGPRRTCSAVSFLSRPWSAP